MSRIHEINTATFKHCTPEGDKLIAEIARVSNPANEKNEATAPRLIRYLIEHNHWSPFQMCSMAIEVNTTRDIGRQILRHLSAIGYQEFSGRYAAYNEVLGYRECRFQHPTNRQLSVEAENEEQLAIVAEWNEYIQEKAQRDEASPRSADKLLQATLRLRPDRIILGELRGSEAATFLDAINTGHSGSFTTLHAHSARKAMDRLALLVMAQGTRLSFAEVIRHLETSIDVILQMGRQGECRGIMEMYFPGLED